MRRNQQEPEPKPFQLVSLPKGQPQRSIGVGHDRAQRNSFSGWLDVQLLTLRPLQVATGITDFVRTSRGEQLMLTQCAIDRIDLDNPDRLISTTVLPGSSLKGAVRSLVEALSGSCVLTVGRLTRAARPSRLTSCNKASALCPACRLFGAQDYQGQVSLADAIVPPGSLAVIGTPLLWAPARSRGRGLPPLYLARGEIKGRKLYEHRQVTSGPDPRMVIKENVIIPLRINITNLTRAELGLLLTALGQHPQYPFCIKLGGGKPVGLGSVEVRVKTVALLSGGEVFKRAGRLGKAIDKAERLEGAVLTERIAEWVRAAETEKVLLSEQLREVAQVLHRDNLKRPAPRGLY